MKFISYTIFLLACVLSIVIPARTFAAELIVSASSSQIYAGDEFQVDLMLDTQGQTANALGSTINFPDDLVTLKEIRDGDSIINFWIESPQVSTSSVSFSGITPGGYDGKGLLFSLIFTAKKSGTGIISLSNSQILNNDGAGSNLASNVSDLSFAVSAATSSGQDIAQIADHSAPETFVPEVGRDPNLFGDKWFLAFVAEDKGSGIAGYQVKEYKYPLFDFSKWSDVESPYVLADQSLQSYISVKAIDKAGNARVITIPPENPIPFYANWQNLFILILVIILALVYKNTLWKKHRE